MNVQRFLDHWRLAEHPFVAEEARHDPVFARLEYDAAAHPDFGKVLGDLSRPSTAIVFGEKGSGKTAIRLQLERRLDEHNTASPDRRIMLVAYDDLNPMLDRLAHRLGVDERSDEKETLRALKRIRLVDHIDGILHVAVTRVVDGLLGDAEAELGRDAAKAMRQASPELKRDLMILQTLYDRERDARRRTVRLRQTVRAPGDRTRWIWKALAATGWVPAAAFFVWAWFIRPGENAPPMRFAEAFLIALIVLWLIPAAKFGWDALTVRRISRRIARELRSVRRTHESLSPSIARLPRSDRAADTLPLDGGDEIRYELLARLRRILGRLGYAGALVVMDRVDEPTLINGDPGRMRAVIWPLLNNKLLQHEGLGFKLLLPLELRHELFRESSDFFQEARLDKQSLVERLTWTGSLLYDLCGARLRACAAPDIEQPPTLISIFDEDVEVKDVVDALDQMHQPRDAFKLLYQCIQEHCSNVTEDEAKWRIPRHVLDVVRRQQAERLQMFHRGVRPA
ncbi:MAG: hypothetical protein RIB32_03115 [Phycisphaerales bacterium]